MGLLSNKEDLALLLKEFSSLKEEIIVLNKKVDEISDENKKMKDYIQKSVHNIIDNQIKIENKIILYKNDYLDPTYTNALNTVQWVYDIKEKIKKI
jgi:hypothetical protein